MTEENYHSDLPHEVARAAELLLDRKAVDVTLLDLRKVSTATDFFLIATGRSDTHVSAIGDHVVDELKKQGVRPSHVEGLRTGRWRGSLRRRSPSSRNISSASSPTPARVRPMSGHIPGP